MTPGVAEAIVHPAGSAALAEVRALWKSRWRKIGDMADGSELGRLAGRRKRSFRDRAGRLLRLRLIVPLKRSRHPPEYTARGVAIGLAFAFTPTVGIQLYLLLALWAVLKPFKGLRFNAVAAFTWTWVTNVFTMLPLYYLFYVTGQVVLGRWSDLTGWQAFVGTWQDIVLNGRGGVWESLLHYVEQVAGEEWVPLIVGCIPYVVLFGWAGYACSLRYLRRRREAARLRAQRRVALKAAAP